jgi:hypothetical protein
MVFGHFANAGILAKWQYQKQNSGANKSYLQKKPTVAKLVNIKTKTIFIFNKTGYQKINSR